MKSYLERLQHADKLVGSYFLSGNPAPIDFAGMQGRILEVSGNFAFVLVIAQKGQALGQKMLIPLEKMVGFTFYESMEAMTPHLLYPMATDDH